ncbi:MAG: UDP-4-amino-4,6-dideoxy-N-acetyl-beta-L-altrosamine transaminase [Pseudomonadales bacterium]
MIRIPYGRHFIDDSDIDAVVNILKNGSLTQGPMVEEFEQAVADFVGAKYAVAVANGTAALHLAYLSLGVGPGDAIITSPNTFVATANGAHFAGAEAKFVDINPNTLNMDPQKLAAACESVTNVKVISPVHFAGYPSDMQRIRSIANKVGARVVEDAAHALGATYADGGRIGNCSHSDITLFSFHPVKMIAAGEGGMLTTNDQTLYHRLLRLRSHGINKGDDAFENSTNAMTNGLANPWYYEMQELGFNYRITDIQCGLALSQLGKLNHFLERRYALVKAYDKVFSEMPAVTLPQLSGRNLSAHHLYVLRIDFESINISRAQLITDLLAQGIGTQVHYIPVHMHPYYQKHGFSQGDFPETEAYYREALSIPLYFSLSDSDQQYVIENIKNCIQA